MRDEIQSATFKDKVVDYYTREIISGRLSPGDKLPGERDIADNMQVSRSIVHLAMEKMAQLGLLEMIPRKGNYVSDYLKKGNIETILMMSKFGFEEIDQSIDFAIVELRNAIEGGALTLLSKNGSKEDFDCLKELNEDIHMAILNGADLDEIASLHRDFHFEIVSRCGNCFYLMLMNSFYDMLTPWTKCVKHWTSEGVLEQNKKIINLLESGNGEEASKYISDIFEKYKQEVYKK